MSKTLLTLIFLTTLGFVSTARSQTSEADGVAKSLYQEVLASLPHKFTREIEASDVQITTGKLSNISSSICTPGDKNRVIFGEFRKNKIVISSELIRWYLQKGDYKINCPHTSLKKLIQATMLHELAHIFDRKGRYSNTDQYAAISFFEKTYYRDENSDNNETRFSINNKNVKFTRSPDTYEFKSISENFAVNVEHYFLDKKFACRRPLKTQYLNDLFEIEIENDCETDYSLPLIDGDSFKHVNIHPDRVKRISYLLAGKGDGFESKFGHAQVLLEVCEDENCKKLQKYVFGFIADTPAKYSAIGGLTGEYKSRIFIGSFLQTRLEYNVLELRDITEYPLKFSRAQKQRFLGLLLSSFWEYNGAYKFITNNCASELFQIFKYAVNDEGFYRQHISTPSAIVETLNSYNLIDTGKVQTYFGDRVLSEKLKKLKISIDPKAFIALDPVKRKEYFDRITNDSDVFTFLLAESLSLQHWNKKVNSYILKTADKGSEIGAKIEKLRSIMDSLNQGHEGYGIPTYESDEAATIEDRTNSINLEIHKELLEIHELINRANLDISNALKNIKVNKNLLNKKLSP